MKNILFATTNKQKVRRLSFLTPVKLLSLSDLPYEIIAPKEEGEDALDIAIFKARYYWKSLKEKIPVITQDDTLKLEVNPEDDPGSSIKEPVVKGYGEFNDVNAIKYYSDLSKKYGGTIPMYFEYGHAICLSDGEEMIKARKSKLAGQLVMEPHENETTKGYFLAALMQVKIDGKWKYYSELNERELISCDSGIAESLAKILK